MKRNTITLTLILLVSAGVLAGWSYSQKSNGKTASHLKGSSPDVSLVKLQPQPESKSLVAIMGMMISSMQEIDLGLYNENYSIVEKGAGNIADHAPIKKEDLQLVKKTLEQDMNKFQELDMQVHHHADSLRMAARQENMVEILRHYSIVQQGCIDCHARFRSSIRTARTNN